MNTRKLPIGIQTFAKIREDDCYYVDKTGFIRQLIAEALVQSDSCLQDIEIYV